MGVELEEVATVREVGMAGEVGMAAVAVPPAREAGRQAPRWPHTSNDADVS